MKITARHLAMLTLSCFVFSPNNYVLAASGGVDETLSLSERLSLARKFVNRISPSFQKVDVILEKDDSDLDLQGYADGEGLLLQPVLSKRLRLEGLMLSEVSGDTLLVSLIDFAGLLDLAITVNGDEGTAKGWYILEKNRFDLDLNQARVETPKGVFVIPDVARAEGEDIFVPVDHLALWLGMKMKAKVKTQDIYIESDDPFPLEARLKREKWKPSNSNVSTPSLPDKTEGYKVISLPAVDVTTRTTFENRSGSDEMDNLANVSTVGDLAYGSLSTFSQWNDEDGLTRARVKYKQDSVDGGLLGKLDATLFEVGDIQAVRVPLNETGSQELGFHVTNENPLRSFSRPTTAIKGQASPDWDIELYKGEQLLAFTRVREDGLYSFDDVILSSNNNNFRLEFYGPQGERRSEDLYIPVDNDLASQGEAIYDVSVSLDNKGTYYHRDIDQEDDGTLNISALFEKPLRPGLTGVFGFRSGVVNSERDYVVSSGLSANVFEFLVNSDVAIDNEGDAAAEFTLRRDFGHHEFFNAVKWQAGGFDQDSATLDGDELDFWENDFRLTGPLMFAKSRRHIYNISNNYKSYSNGDYESESRVGAQVGWKQGVFNTFLTHRASQNDGYVDKNIGLASAVSAVYGPHRFRLNTNYEVHPENELERVTGAYNYRYSNDLDFGFDISNQVNNDLTEYTARLDWQAGFIRISPSITYDTENEYYAALTTRFGLLHDPNSGIAMMDRNITSSGTMSAFVYLDKDGNGKFDGDDEPLPDVIVTAPQNGRRMRTDENGSALFSRMTRLRTTDVYVDQGSLQDPSWITGYEGASITPREGYVARIEFPVHRSGEIDGTIFVKGSEAGEESFGLRNIPILLYNDRGEVQQRTRTDSSGFYYMTQIPPGRYLLMLDHEAAQERNIIRPPPQKVEIGYDGTIYFGNDITVRSGDGDVPSVFLASLADYRTQNAANFDPESYDLVLNLGEYNSRLMMSIVWYRLKSRYGNILANADLFVSPTQSYADAKTGKHTLRVGLRDTGVKGAYSRCRSLMARDLSCKVEIFPSYIKEAKVDVQSVR